MTKIILTAMAAAAAACPQTSIGIRTTPATQDSPQTMTIRRDVEAVRPLLGYLTNSANVLYSVVGSPANPLWGEPLLLPDSTAIAFLPPRQEYALLASETGLSVARLSRSAVYPGAVISSAMRRPDRVSFSPSGEAAALFSSIEARMEVLTYVAGKAQVRWGVSMSNPDQLVRFTVSDDGELAVAAFANKPVLYSLHGAPWQQLATNYWPDGWTFLPHSHNLVLSDRAQKTIVVLPQPEHAPIMARVLTSMEIDADLVSAGKHGTQLLAAATGSSRSWSIDLASGVITALADKAAIDSITVLRDGQTFLVSATDSPVVVKLSNDAVQPAATNTSIR